MGSNYGGDRFNTIQPQDDLLSCASNIGKLARYIGIWGFNHKTYSATINCYSADKVSTYKIAPIRQLQSSQSG